MKAMISTIDDHVKDAITTGGMPKLDKLFNLSKGSKEDAPLDGFVNYYAYKSEERKYNLRYNKNLDPIQAALMSRPLNPIFTQLEYTAEKYYNHREYFLTQKQYCDLEFMNGAPEIVCEIIYHLSGYLHHRTDFMTYDTYKQMMIGQLEDRNIASSSQKDIYSKVGWKEDADGI